MHAQTAELMLQAVNVCHSAIRWMTSDRHLVQKYIHMAGILVAMVSGAYQLFAWVKLEEAVTNNL